MDITMTFSVSHPFAVNRTCQFAKLIVMTRFAE